MRIVSLILIAALALPAQADPGRGPRPHGGGGGGDWFGFALFTAITALILTSEMARQSEPPTQPQQPVYIEPPANTAPAPSANTWYYCGSSGQYYPYTQACPEGWQAVPAQPQN